MNFWENLVILLGAVFGLVFFVVYLLAANECKQKGGVLVESFLTYECVERMK